MKRLFFGVLCAALVGGFLFAGSAGQVSADTIGDVLDNTGSTIPKDKNGQPWNMYQIPGLYTSSDSNVSRDHGMNEGSFVKSGVASDGMPLSGVDSSGNPDPSGYKNATMGSPANIQFTNGSTKFGTPWYSVNYVDKPNFIDFGNKDIASNLAKGTTPYYNNPLDYLYNPDGVKSKMNLDSNNNYTLDKGQSFNGGYLQIAGNVPIRAQIATTHTTINAIEAGDWGVMARLTFPKGVDAKALASSVDWDKSHFYLSLDSIPVTVMKIKIFSVDDITFPLQFDHHIYQDPSDPQSFFLKVKGLPFKYNVSNGADSAQMQLQKGYSDALDYLHNRHLDSDSMTMKTMDTVTNDSDSDIQNGQPEFPVLTGGSGVPWDPFHGLIYEYLDPALKKFWLIGQALSAIVNWFIGANNAQSPIYESGYTGRTVSLLNGQSDFQSPDRLIWGGNGDSHFDLFKTLVINPIMDNIVKYFTGSAFSGTAHINFSFDMSKYAATDGGAAKQALTSGKLFASPYADGGFNKNGGVDSSGTAGKNAGTDAANDPNRRSIGIEMYDSNQLVDPYNVIKGMDTNTTDSETSGDAIFKQLKAGTTPTDYAVVKKSEVNNGTQYPVYTNFTSWNGAIVPYDRMHWNDTTDTTKPQETTFTDTLHSDGKIGSDINNRTATPDPAQDGILANDGTPFTVEDQAAFRSDESKYQRQPSTGKLAQVGVIRPQRYANVYQMYDYSKSEPTPESPEPVDYDTAKPQVVASRDTNTDSSHNITSDLDGKEWNYTGTMNGMPLADATIKLKQSLSPTLNLSLHKLLVVTKSQVTGNTSFKSPLGTWRDPLAINGNDSMRLDFSSVLSQQTATTDQLGGDTGTHTVTGDWWNQNTLDSSSASNAKMVVDNGNVTPYYQLPMSADSTSHFFYGVGTLTRNKDVPVVQNYTLSKDVDGTATDNYYLLLDDDSPSDMWYSADKVFKESNGQTDTVHYLQTNDKTVHVVVTVKHKSGNKLPTDKNLTVRVPNVQQDTKHVGATADPTSFKVTSVDSGNNVTSNQITDDKGWLADNFTSFNLKFDTVPENFTYEYDYSIANQDDIPLLTQYQDLIADSNRTLAVSNGVQFDKMKSANLIKVPTLDFGTHSIPTANDTEYGLVDKDDSSFTVRNNDNNSSSWTLWGTMSPFTTDDQLNTYSDFTVNLNQPATNSDGTAETGITPVSGPPTLQWDDSQWRYYNHSPIAMISNQQRVQLYNLNRLHGDKDNTETDLTRYYPNAKLTVPADQYTPNKYTANVTYLLSDDGTL
ncbi:hypothetical protein [Schleiferilactobacillus perolens]|uniref:hypothetical protein n=1 Tax=Schleiferilactobacillus perolens TaxID=100468 RepID=UPI0023567F0E|nr:hypothetical protein [Schleiferilactobacillus perolens]MCI2170299.1 hypothetical protein [Schleiferilactobacillus perolens]